MTSGHCWGDAEAQDWHLPSGSLAALTRVPLEQLGLLFGASGGGGSLPTALLVPVLPPAPQLEVDEAPHHRGLEEAHQQQHTHSARGGEEAG